MKHLISNLTIAVICTLFSFWLFKTYYLPQALAAASLTNNVQLVSNKVNAVNQSPRMWKTGLPEDFTEVAKNATQAVVNITTFNSDGYRIASGSGVINSAARYLATPVPAGINRPIMTFSLRPRSESILPWIAA